MTKFTINAENVKRLLSLTTQSKELLSLTKPVFCPTENSLSVNLYSARTALSFSVDISEFSTDETIGFNYFNISIPEFTSALQLTSNSCSGSVEINVDKSNNTVYFKSLTTGTVISKPIYNNTVSDEEAQASVTAVEDIKSTYLQNPISLEINQDIMNFYEAASKFMNNTKNAQNTIAIDGDKIRYGDQTIIIEKKLPKSFSDKEIYLKKSLLDNLKTFIKASGVLTLYLTEDFDFAFFESNDIGYKAVFGLEESRYMYPTEEEAKAILPDESCGVKIKLLKKNLQDAFVPFNGTFKASGDTWNWKATTIKVNKDVLDSGKISLVHKDWTGSAETTVPVTVLANTESATDGELIVSIQVIEELLSIIPEDEVTITLNCLSPNEEHGAAILIETDTVKAISVKFRPAA